MSEMEFPSGSRVRVDGLVAAQQHNGKAGVVRDTLNPATGRIGVMLDTSASTVGLSIKPANLTLLAPATGSKIRGVHGCGMFPGPGFTETDLSPDHAIFRQGELSPILTLCGIPLLVMRTFECPKIQAIPEFLRENNRPAMYVMTNPHDGYCLWQGGGSLPNIGEVTFVRQDRLPFTCTHLAVLWDFFMGMCDSGDWEKPLPISRFCRRFFLSGFGCHRDHVDGDREDFSDMDEATRVAVEAQCRATDKYNRECSALVWYEDEVKK